MLFDFRSVRFGVRMYIDFLFTFFGFRHRITSFLFNQGCRRFLNSEQDTSAKFSLLVGKRDCMVFGKLLYLYCFLIVVGVEFLQEPCLFLWRHGCHCLLKNLRRNVTGWQRPRCKKIIVAAHRNIARVFNALHYG